MNKPVAQQNHIPDDAHKFALLGSFTGLHALNSALRMNAQPTDREGTLCHRETQMRKWKAINMLHKLEASGVIVLQCLLQPLAP